MKIIRSTLFLIVSLAVAIPTNPWLRDSSVYEHATTFNAPVSRAYSHESDESPLFQRDTARTKCSPALHINAPNSSGSTRRAALLNITQETVDDFPLTIESLNDKDLWKRVMSVPQDTSNAAFDKWYKREVREMFGAVYDDTVSTAIYMKIKDEAMSLGLSHLCGCTTLVVYSKTAVYIGHYFENLSFSPDPGTLYGSDNGGTPDIAFQQTVIKGLTNGIKPSGPGATDGQDALSGHADDFNNKDAKAWLIIPSVGLNDDPDPYREQWQQIGDTIKRLYPEISYNEHQYEPLDKSNNLLATSRGKLLWKYDPQDPATSSRTQPHRLIKFWSEYNLLDTLHW